MIFHYVLDNQILTYLLMKPLYMPFYWTCILNWYNVEKQCSQKLNYCKCYRVMFTSKEIKFLRVWCHIKNTWRICIDRQLVYYNVHINQVSKSSLVLKSSALRRIKDIFRFKHANCFTMHIPCIPKIVGIIQILIWFINFKREL